LSLHENERATVRRTNAVGRRRAHRTVTSIWARRCPGDRIICNYQNPRASLSLYASIVWAMSCNRRLRVYSVGAYDTKGENPCVRISFREV
jgi:hypothetical protein